MEQKTLMEKRAELFEKLENDTKAIEAEQRAFTEEEEQAFEQTRAEIESIDRTFAQLERAKNLRKTEQAAGAKEESAEALEVRAFADFIRNRATDNVNMAKGDNGAVIPKTIADKIVDRIKDISPLFRDATKYNIRGTVSVPYVDAANDKISVAYATEFTDLTSQSTQLLSVDLTDFLAGALAKVSMSLLNDTDINLVDFVVNKLAMSTAVFIDKEIIQGTAGKVTGLSTASQVISAAAATAVTADEIIRLKDQIKSAYQNGAYFVMNPATLTAIRLLKDGNQRYLFNDDITEGFSGTILGKPVYVSDQCPVMASGVNAIFYVNPAEALAVKLVEESVQPLREAFAIQHALGIVEWVDFDAKIVNQQAVAVLQMA